MDSHPDLLAALPVPRPLRHRPAAPVFRHAVFSPDGQRRLALMQIWGPGPKLCWVTYWPDSSTAEKTSLAIERIATWTHKAGPYHGFLVVSLYPQLCRNREAAAIWREQDPKAIEHCDDAAAAAANFAKRLQCRDLVIATGPLTQSTRDDFENWLEVFVTLRGRRGRWFCLGTTETGWPLPPVGRGRIAVPVERPLVPWRIPNNEVVERRRPVAPVHA